MGNGSPADPYRRPFEAILDAAVVLDATTGLILAANQAATKIFGFSSPNEMVGLNPLDYVAEEDRKPIALLLAQGLQVDRPIPAEIRMKTKDGRAIWVSATSTPIEHEGKKASLTAIREITSEKATDAALRDAERRYENLFDGMMDGAVVLDISTFQIAYANKAAAEMFGFSSPREIVGENPLSYIPEEDRDAVAREIALNLQGEGRNPAEVRVITRDKTILWVSATATTIDYEGRTATLTTLRDITADKAKDAALKAAEESKLRLIDAAAESIFVVQDWKMVYVNPAGAAVAGLSQKDMIGLSFQDFVHPDQREALTERYEKLLAGQWFSDFTTVKGIDAKGETRWAEIREIPYSWQGRPAVMSLVHDITDRMRADEERKEREERLRAIIENAWDGITILDENYNVIFESPSLARISGYTPEEWMGRPVGQMNIHPDDLAPLLAKIETLKSQPGSVITDVKIRYHHKDGSWRWIEATGRNLLHDPKVKGLVVNFRDITENVRADEERRASEERFRTLIEKATDVVIVLDATGKITYQSPSLERVTGFGHDEWVGRPLDQLLIHPDDLTSLATLLERVLTQPGATFEGITARYQHKDGSWHVLEATVTNMLHDPKVAGIVANFRDITDRKEAEEKLKGSEDLYRSLVLISPDAVTVSDLKGNFTFVSPQTARLHGYDSTEELLGRSAFELTAPEDQAKAASLLEALFVDGFARNVEATFLRKDGSRFLGELSAALIRDANGDPNSIVGYTRDITERKRAEEALREAKEYAENVIKTANVIVVALDTQGKVTLLNEAGEEITGYLQDEVLGKNWFELVAPRERYPNVWAEFSKLKSAGEIIDTFENPILTKSGEERLISWKNSRLVVNDKVIGTLSFGTDITERKKAEETLQESEEKFRLLTEMTNDIIWMTDMDLRTTYISPSAEKLLGFRQEEILGSGPESQMTPESVARAAETLLKQLQMEQDPVADPHRTTTLELEYYRKDGSTVWMENRVGGIRDANGRLIGLHGVARDVTERRKAELTLRESEEKYRLLTEKTNDVIYTIDLDFNNTYVSPSVERILGFTPEEYLGRSPDQRMTRESLARAQEALLEHLSLEKDPKADPNRTVRIELEFYRKDGSTVWLEHQVSGLRDANGTAIGLHGVARDVTERRKAEQALRDSEAIYKRLFENTQTAMEVVSGETGLVVLANETTARMFGFDSAEDLVGVDSMEYLLPEDRDRVAAEMAQAIANKDHSGATELSVRTKDGQLLWINALVTYTEYAGKTSLLISLIDLTSRKRAEEKLKASEEKYRLLAEKTNDIIWTSDLSLHTTYVSPSVERILGFTPEERVKQDVTAQMTPESTARAADALAQHLALEKDPEADPNRTLRIELEYYRKDGSTAWLENQVSGIRDASGTLVGLHGVGRDISERKRVDMALTESRERYRSLFDGSPDCVYVHDFEGNFLDANRAALKLLGFDGEDIPHLNFASLLSEDQLPTALAALEELKETGAQKRVTAYTLRCKNGGFVDVETVASVIHREGKPHAIQGVARDVTERRKAEQALQASEEKYRLITEKTNDMLWTTDMNLRVTYVSPSVGRILGFTPEEHLKRDLSQQITPESLARAHETLLAQLALEHDPNTDPRRTVLLELEYYQKNGSVVWLENRISGIRDANGGLIGLHGVARDVTERRRAEEALRERLKELQCIASISRLAEKSELPVEDFVREAVGLLPTAWRYPEICGASIMLDSKEFKTANYRETEWSQSADIGVDEKRFGTVTVCYLQEMPGADEGPFLKEERDLINTVADFMGHVIQHRQVEWQLRSSEERFRTLIEKSTDAIAILDGSGHLVYESPSMERITGYKLEDWVGKPVGDWLLHPDDLVAMASLLERLMTHLEVTSEEVSVRFKHKDGTWHYLEGTVRNLINDSKVGGLVINYRDITERVKAEQALKESEEKNRLLIDNAAEGIIVVQDGVTRFSNRRCTEVTGRSPEALLAGSFLDIVHPEDREMVALNYMKRVAGEDVPNNYQFRTIDEEGNTKWLQVNAVRLTWEGRPATLTMLSDVTDRVKAEQALRDSEERFRALVEKATDAVAVLDAAGNVLYYTPSMERVTGYRPGEWVNKSLSDLLLHPDDLPKLASVLEQVLKEPGASVENFTTRYQHQDGTWHVLEATARNMLHDPKIGGVVANFRDITERVKAEEKLKESEERYRLLAENAADVIWVADLNLRITYASPAVARLLGYTIEEVTDGSFLNRALTPDSLSSMAHVFTDDLGAEQIKAGTWKPRAVEIEVVSKDGLKYWLEAVISDIRDTEGRLIAFQGACRNITDRKKAEVLLRASEERFRGLVETTSDWVWEIDRNSRYTYVSPRVRDVLGYEPEEVLGHTPFQFMHQREGRRVSKIVRRFAAESLPFSLMENTCIHKDGHSVVMETSAVPIIGSDGSFLGYRGIDRDITERKKAEQELQRSLKRLEKTMESTIEAITTTIETRDPYTTGHQMRVTDLACAIAKVMEVPPTQIEGIRVAGLLHDIGKIAIPTEILSKPGKLNDVEYEMIKTHSKVGYNILKKIEFPWPVARAVLQHHERWNGSGYPHGIRGEDILLEARILAVADVMEAMSSHRPYRPTVGADKALEEITRNSGILYDPAVADACITAFTQAGFKFAPSLPGAAVEPEITSASHPVDYLDDQ